MRQIVGDRTTLFFIVVLPVVVIVVIGATFGSAASFQIGVVHPTGADGSVTPIAATATAIERRLDLADGVDLKVYESEDDLRGAVRRQAISLGVLISGDIDALLSTREAAITVVADPTSQGANAALDIVRSAVADVVSPVDAAGFAAGVSGASLDEAIAATEAVQPFVGAVTVRTSDVGDARSGTLSSFSLTAPQNLVLFVFINALAGGASLVRMRRMGVLRRVLAGPIGSTDIVIGVSAAWMLVSLLQSALIVAVGSIVFGVSWGDPVAATSLVFVFAAVGAGAGLLIGAVGANEDRVSAIGPPVGIVLGALGGCMVPLEVFPDTMRDVAKAVPHYWAMTAWQRLIFDGDRIGSIAADLLVLAAFAIGFLLLAAILLRRSLVRG
jgi:ABC-2 type transport system permease protein